MFSVDVIIKKHWSIIGKNKFFFFLPKVTWLKDEEPVEINRNGRLILSNENSLLIAQIETSDAGNYTCVASNIVGSQTSEPAELIVHGKHIRICHHRFLIFKCYVCCIQDDRGWSEWQPFSECKGLPCGTGRQRRIRTCLNPPTITNRPSCEGDQIQERECQMPCSGDLDQTPTGKIKNFISQRNSLVILLFCFVSPYSSLASSFSRKRLFWLVTLEWLSRCSLSNGSTTTHARVFKITKNRWNQIYLSWRASTRTCVYDALHKPKQFNLITICALVFER